MKRQILYLTLKQLEKIVHSPSKLTKLVISGHESDIRACLNSKKVDKLKENGVLVNFKTIPATTMPTTINSTQKQSYRQRLFEKVSLDPLQKNYFLQLFPIPLQPGQKNSTK